MSDSPSFRGALIRDGSFRGVPFLYQDHTLDGGRRNARHVYPKRERGNIEDMGRKLREFTLDVFIIGDDWMVQRNSLLAALETPGPGTLVHPAFGTFDVTVPDFRLIENAQSLGRADFQITFLEAGDISFAVTAASATGSQVGPAAAAASSAMQAAASSSFATSGFANWLPSSAQATISSAISALQSAIAPIAAFQDAATTAVYSVTNTFDGIVSDALTLVDTPSTLMSAIAAAVADVSTIGFPAFAWTDVFAGTATPDSDTLGQVLGQQQGLASFGLGPLPGAVSPAPAVAATTASRVQDGKNAAALCSVVRVQALGEASQAAVAFPWTDSDSAAAARDALDALIDAESLTQTDGPTVQALVALRLALIREMNTIAAQLPPLLTFTPAASIPAVVLAYRLYGDPSWAEDIVARNNIVHPLFVPGGQPLEILGRTAA
jgi:prophage DNA circulation protein